MALIPLKTPSASYDITIAPGLIKTLPARLKKLKSGKPFRTFIVTSPEIWGLWGRQVQAAFAKSEQPTVLFLPAGEKHKRLRTLEGLLEQMAAAGADRDALLVAFGGGVVGDVTGFLAAVYMRGVPYVQVPTTLLAQVDSSVGGKTGVNLAAGKNLVGSFHHPLAVLADTDVLTTLPKAELRAGLQESVKAGIIRDAKLFAYLEKNADAVLSGDAKALAHVVTASVRVKADVVANDERESGLRMILNYGHTLGHAIEAATGYKQLLHGEAVGWGSIAATRLGLMRGMITEREAERMIALIVRYGPLSSFKASADRLVELTANDKKNRSGQLSFILPVKIGEVAIVRDVTRDEMKAAAEWTLALMRSQGAAGEEEAMMAEHRSRMEHELSTGARPVGATSEETAAANVQRMFDSIAPKYDLLNHLLSMGLDRQWWARAARTFRDVLVRPDAAVLDLCCGTGDMTMALMKHRPVGVGEGPVYAVDFSHEMLERGREKFAGRNIVAIEADALHLPMSDGALDLVVSAFGFRNLANYEEGLAELYRVLGPGGQIGILDCNQPEGAVGALYDLYFKRVLPKVGGMISGDARAYRYLPASVERFPRPKRMLEMIRAAGFGDAGWTSYTFGTAGLYRATKP